MAKPKMISTRTQRRSPEPARTSTTPPVGGIVLVDSSFRPIALDSRAEAILGDSAAPDGGVSLPPELLNLLSAQSPLELEGSHLRVNAGDHEYSCRTFVLHPRADSAVQPMLALYLKRDRSVADAMRQVGTDYHLTDRELEALIGVAMGLTSKELATRMNISPNTVKAFLRLIMIKMGVTTRAGIVGKLFDQNGQFSDV